METNEETVFYDLSVDADRLRYATDLAKTAIAWAENFEEGGGGDGTPYELGQGDDLWIDVSERWPQDFYDEDVVSDLEAAREVGVSVCELAIKSLVGKRPQESLGPYPGPPKGDLQTHDY